VESHVHDVIITREAPNTGWNRRTKIVTASRSFEPVKCRSPRKLPAVDSHAAWFASSHFFLLTLSSAEHTGTSCLRLLHCAVRKQIRRAVPAKSTFLVRKSAHFCSYGFLGTLWHCFSWPATLPRVQRWTFRWSSWRSSSRDRWRSRRNSPELVSSRTFQLADVLIDMIGAIFFQVGIGLWIVAGKNALPK